MYYSPYTVTAKAFKGKLFSFLTGFSQSQTSTKKTSFNIPQDKKVSPHITTNNFTIFIFKGVFLLGYLPVCGIVNGDDMLVPSKRLGGKWGRVFEEERWDSISPKVRRWFEEMANAITKWSLVFSKLYSPLSMITNNHNNKKVII